MLAGPASDAGVRAVGEGAVSRRKVLVGHVVSFQPDGKRGLGSRETERAPVLHIWNQLLECAGLVVIIVQYSIHK